MWDGVIGGAIGLTLVFVILSLIVSGIQELISATFKLRSKNLRKGITRLLGDDAGAVKAFYAHSLLRSLTRSNTSLPSYISSKQFARVLADHAGLSQAASEDEVRAAIGTVKSRNARLGEAIESLARSAGHDPAKLQAEIAGWFDDAMERVSGWYARTARLIGLGVALIVVVLMNADSIRIGKSIWTNAELRTTLETMAIQASADDNLELPNETIEAVLANLPLGWSCPGPGETPAPASDADICLGGNFHGTSVIGWLITIFAISLGAPFWFDLLGRVARLRTAGGRPKSTAETTAA